MDHSLKSDSRLEMSISFGRFENDAALSWEKWSSFSPNKYLEEVGSLSTPGSVAQKKAYFEAHYKKIAAQKAEALEQEKAMESYGSSKEAFVSDSSEIYDESGTANGADLVQEVSEESCLSISSYVDDGKAPSFVGSETEACKTTSVDEITSGEERVDSVTAVNGGSSGVDEAPKEMNGDVDHPESNVASDAGLETVDSCQEDSRGSAENHSVTKDVLEKHGKKKSNTNNTGNAAQKVTQTKERYLTGTRKKVVSTATREIQASRNTKPPSVSTPTSAPQHLKKKTVTPQPKSKTPVVGDRKGLAPTSLHMSINSGPASSSGDHSLMRKSLIMERLVDKNIVRRAFKTFQKRDYASSSSTSSSPAQKLSTVKNESLAALEPTISISRTPVKGNERVKKDSEKRTPSGTRSTPLPSGLHKMSPLDRKYAASFSPRGSTSDEKSEKRKEFLKKLEANSIARAAKNKQQNRTSNAKVGVKN